MPDLTHDWSDREAADIRDQLGTLLESVIFARAERLSRFLRYVVERTLAGRAQSLNQYAIAIDVFDRDASFDPAIDAIVRVEAGRLRSKLLEYYDEVGRDDAIRIELPKRSYAAVFRQRPAPPEASPVASGVGTEEFHREVLSRDEPARTLGSSDPVIAVLPFQNFSPDPEQEYFADGVTEDLITDLSKLPGVHVISRQSSFAYRGATASVQQVCRELGANLVLEGSVRKVGDRVRITAQLIEGERGHHLWAQRYDRDLENIFEIQDEVNRKIVSACSLQLSEAERKKGGGTRVIDAYDYVLRGMKETQANTAEGSARARYCFESALELDPSYAAAHARLSLNYVFRWIQGWSQSPEDSVDKGLSAALAAVALDDRLALAHAAACWAYLWSGDHDKAIAEGRLSVELDPNEVVALERLALCMTFGGQAQASLPLLDKAKSLDPNHTYDFPSGLAAFMLSEYSDAIAPLQRSFRANPSFIPAGLYLAASHALGGSHDEAEATIAEIKRTSPDYRIATASRTQFKRETDRERFIGGLRRAGLF